MRWANKIGEAYNKTFVNNWEYYPLTQREIKFAVDNILTVAVPQYIKIIAHGDDVVGFLFGFPDISAAIQRQKGHITPWGLADFMLEFKKTRFISLNGVGVLPEYKGRGAVALLYDEMANVLQNSPFLEGELTQMAETAKEVRRELQTYGAVPWKNHRIYTRKV
jgi:ribosomal protein S18 acetylase RimI-like enzyme